MERKCYYFYRAFVLDRSYVLIFLDGLSALPEVVVERRQRRCGEFVKWSCWTYRVVPTHLFYLGPCMVFDYSTEDSLEPAAHTFKREVSGKTIRKH
jgi:hypothetical protein